MQSARGITLVLFGAVMALSGCFGSDKTPELMNLRSSTQGPDEFAILPPKPLSMPEDLSALPEPTPGGSNLTDPTPNADAVAALGGNINAGANAGALVTAASRYGVSSDIRAELAADDLAWRQKHNGRFLERLFNVNTYFKAYDEQLLDQQAELWRWRKAGAKTPSAPPPQDGE